jgi:hypothetical protein
VSFAARDQDQLRTELQAAEERLAAIREAVADGRAHPHVASMAAYIVAGLRRAVDALETPPDPATPHGTPDPPGHTHPGPTPRTHHAT